MILSAEYRKPRPRTQDSLLRTIVAVDRSDRHPVHQTPGVVRQNFNEEVDQYE